MSQRSVDLIMVLESLFCCTSEETKSQYHRYGCLLCGKHCYSNETQRKDQRHMHIGRLMRNHLAINNTQKRVNSKMYYSSSHVVYF